MRRTMPSRSKSLDVLIKNVLSQDVLFGILKYLHPKDLSQMSLTNKYFRDFYFNNLKQLLTMCFASMQQNSMVVNYEKFSPESQYKFSSLKRKPDLSSLTSTKHECKMLANAISKHNINFVNSNKCNLSLFGFLANPYADETIGNAIACFNSAQFTRAIKLLVSYLDNSYFFLGKVPDTINAKKILGFCHARMGNYAQSNFYLSKLKDEPKSMYGLLDTRIILEVLMDNYVALEQYDKALELYNARGNLNISNDVLNSMYLKSCDIKDKIFDRANRELLERLTSDFAAKKFKECIESIEKLKNDPNQKHLSPKILFILALAYEAIGKHENSNDILQKILIQTRNNDLKYGSLSKRSLIEIMMDNDIADGNFDLAHNVGDRYIRCQRMGSRVDLDSQNIKNIDDRLNKLRKAKQFHEQTKAPTVKLFKPAQTSAVYPKVEARDELLRFTLNI